MTASRYFFRRIASDREGYYYDRWDRAVPVQVLARTDEDAYALARQQAGQPPAGRYWKLHLDKVEAVSAHEPELRSEGAVVIDDLTDEQQEIVLAMIEELRKANKLAGE